MERKGWFDWRAVRSVLIGLIVLLVVISLLVFVAQRLISPSSSDSTGQRTVKTTETLP